MLTLLGLLVMVAVLLTVYNLLEAMFERGGDAASIMITFAALFMVSEAGVASALNDLITLVRGQPSVLLSAEVARTGAAPLFPLLLVPALTWFVWPHRQMLGRALMVALLGACVSVAVHV